MLYNQFQDIYNFVVNEILAKMTHIFMNFKLIAPSSVTLPYLTSTLTKHLQILFPVKFTCVIFIRIRDNLFNHCFFSDHRTHDRYLINVN